jgi:hypothetical protein
VGFPFVAIVTHKGNSADSGHYIGWTRQPTEENGVPGEEDWWKFDGEPQGVDDTQFARTMVLMTTLPRPRLGTRRRQGLGRPREQNHVPRWGWRGLDGVHLVVPIQGGIRRASPFAT